MKTYEFSIIASGFGPDAETFSSILYDGGCDDALVSFQRGHLIIDFAREAESFNDAMRSAVDAVRAAGASATRVEPDPLVSLSDIASRVEMSRAAITQYAQGKRREDFPSPVAKVTSDCPLYHWHTVAQWFYEQGKLSSDMVLQACSVYKVNIAISCGDGNLSEALKIIDEKLSPLPLAG